MMARWILAALLVLLTACTRAAEVPTSLLIATPTSAATTVPEPSTTLAPTTTLDTEPPLLVMGWPPDGWIVTDPEVEIGGAVERGSEVFVTGQQITDVSGPEDTDREFWNALVTLEEGANRLAVTATDPAGNEASLEATIHYRPDVSSQTAGITKVSSDDGEVTLTLDYVDVFSGDDAFVEARADGVIEDDVHVYFTGPNHSYDPDHGYYVRNINPRLRTFDVDPEAFIYLLPEPQPTVGLVPHSGAEVVGVFGAPAEDIDVWYGGHPGRSVFDVLIDDSTVLQMAQNEALLTTYAAVSPRGERTDEARQFGFITEVFQYEEDSRVELHVDFADWFTGDEATSAAREDGAIGPDDFIEGDFYIRNQDSFRASFLIDPKARIQLLGYYPERSPDIRLTDIDVSELAQIFSGQADTGPWYGDPLLSPYWITIDGHRVTRIEEQYLP